jgi:hydroxymethylglutaryl-CoA reductase (NADPH)
MSNSIFTRIPTSHVGPIFIDSMHDLQSTLQNLNVTVPLATYETTLFHSVGRGAKVTRLAKTLKTTLISDHMTRSILLDTKDAKDAKDISDYVLSHQSYFQENIVSKHSKYAKLIEVHTKIVGNLLYIRFGYETGDASGHNMTTFSSDAIANYLLEVFPHVHYVSVSGNYCTDKKVSAVNSILGRGKHVIAEITLSRDILEEVLRTTPEKLIELNIKKNLIGSIASGGLLTANAHYANMLLAFYLATGQDAANIVEGSQGITHCELRGDQLYFSVTLPNIIVGTIGHGKDSEDAQSNLDILSSQGFTSASSLASIAAATVLCGELSLMAALTNPSELTSSHKRIERKPL